MALTLNTLNQLEALLTSDRISYKGSEVRALVDILNALSDERVKATKDLRVVPQQPVGSTLNGPQSAYNEQASAGE